MKREFLKGMNLSSDAIDAIMKENGKDIENSKASGNTAACEALEELEKYKLELDSVNQKLAASDQSLEAAYAKVRELEGAAESSVAAARLECALEQELHRAKARNITAVKALLDMSLISFGDGGLCGLEEQLSNIKKDCAYLFESDVPRMVAVEKTHKRLKGDAHDGMMRAALGLK